MSHADYLRNLQELCPDKELDLATSGGSTLKIPEQHANTASAVLDVIVRVLNLSKSGVSTQAWKLQITDHVIANSAEC